MLFRVGSMRKWLADLVAWFGSASARALTVFAFIALLLLAFAGLADEVAEGDARWLDERLMLALRTADRTDPIGPLWLESAMVDITALGGFTVLALLSALAAGYLGIQRDWRAAALVIASASGGALISEGLKVGFARPRPDLVAQIVETTSMSFPSGHAMLSAVVYLTLGAMLARVQKRSALKAYVVLGAIALTLAIGASRVYLGVHWPTDVLAGWCLGAAWALLCWGGADWVAARAGGSR
jgi:undecaprenyl-diphosphatase